ncbi:MAG: RCC1 domain-containing protein, partial [Polyangiales bacterium]
GAVNLSTLAGGKDFTCGITSAGGVLCWGTGNPTGATSFAVAVAGLSNVTALGLGDDHACALISDGTIRCWGDNTSGQLGDGSNTQSSTPVTVSGISDASAIAAGSRFNCAVRTGGSVNCWGDNTSGQLGDGSQTASNLPVTTTGLSDATQLDAGWEHVCARTRSGHMYCWGSNSGYQLGVVNPRPTATTPQQVRHNLDGAVLAGVAQVSLGGGTTCFLRNDGVTLTCWSANRFGSCGTGASGNNVSTFNNFTLP